MLKNRFVVPAIALLVAGTLFAAPSVRVKDLTSIEGVRSNPLIGYGLVVGLDGTGDGTQARFTIQSVANLLRRSGVQVPEAAIRVKNVAAVMVTARLPAFARPGQQLDVQVASMGDADSLEGGTLLMTPLNGPDGSTYAVAQGSVSLGGGFSGGSGGNTVQKNHPTAGLIPDGGIVERTVPLQLGGLGSFRLLLNQPDFATASRIATALNDHFDYPIAHSEDPGSVRLNVPPALETDPVGLLAVVEAIEVTPDVGARVVVNERTGTVVMGDAVRISKVALAHGNLTVEVTTNFFASQPAPFSERGKTVVLPERTVDAHEDPTTVLTLEDGVSVGELVDALNAMGVTSRDMIAILQAMRAAGALHAELVVL